MEFRNSFDRVKVGLGKFSPSLTKQSEAAGCDLHRILDRYTKTGYLPSSGEAVFGDFSSVGDYQACLDRVSAAQDAFDGLPATLRRRFGDDPAQLVAFLQDPANRAEAVTLGLIDAPQAQVDGGAVIGGEGDKPAAVAKPVEVKK